MNLLKKILFSLLLIIITNTTFGQVDVPGGILFQAIARDANNNAASNRNVYVQIAIKRSTPNGTTDYAESFQVVSSQEGIFSIVIGQGSRTAGVSSLKFLEWSKYTYFVNLKIAIEPTLPDPSWTATNNYVDIGTSQLWTVPYSFTSNSSIFSDSASTISGILSSNKGGTGVNNNGKTITIANNIITKGVGDLTITTTAASNVTFPVSGTLANTQFVSDRIGADTISLSNRIDQLGVNSSSNINLKLNIADTNSMLNSRIGKDTISLSNRINLKADKLNAKIDSSLYVKGRTTITDSLLAKANVLIDSNLYIKGMLRVGGRLLLDSGFLFKDSLLISRGARIDSSLLLKGKLLLKDSLVISGNARVDSNLNVNGRTRLNDSLTVRGVTRINDSLLVRNNVKIDSNLNVNGRTRLNDSLTVRGVTRLSDSLTVRGITRLNDSLLVRNNVKIDSNLNVNGRTRLNDSLTVRGVTRLSDSLTVRGITRLNDSLLARSSVLIDSNLTVRGVTRLNDSLFVKNISILSKIKNDSTTINISLVDSTNALNARINTKVNILDTAAMLANYARKFTQDFKVKIAPGKYLGKYMSGDSVRAKGMTLDQFLNDIITEVVHPTYVLPTVTLTSPTLVDYEIGSNISSINLTNNFVQNDAGAILTTTYKKNGVNLAGTSDNITNITTNQTYSVQINYAAGAIKLNNLDQSDSVGSIAAGSISSTGITLSVKSKRFWGTSSSTNPTDSEIQNAANEFATSKDKSVFSIPISSGTKYLFYAYPAAFSNLNSLSVGGFESLKAFTPITRTFVNAQGHSSAYIIYVSNNNFSSSVDNINCN